MKFLMNNSLLSQLFLVTLNDSSNINHWVRLHQVSDGLIAMAFYSLSLILLYWINQQTTIAFKRRFILLSVCLFGCGTTHLTSILTGWYPVYYLLGLIKIATALVSCLTVVKFIPLLPKALSIKNSAELEIAKRALQLQEINHSLESEIKKRTLIEKQLQITQERLQFLLASSPSVIYTSKPSGDYGTTFISPTVRAILGYEAWQFVENSEFWAQHIHPEDTVRVFAELSHLFETGTHIHEYRFLHKDGRYRWVRDELKLVRDQENKPLEIIGCWLDITERKQFEQQLFQLNRELTQSNHELEQFAYVASHDLQEPLRMVTLFSQLLAKKYQNRLDQDANTYIDYIVDAAARMHQLIHDLLSYSQVGTRQGEIKFKPTDCNQVLAKVLQNLTVAITESHAVIHSDILPKIQADEQLLIVLLQNLISNAIKYRYPDVSPQIKITVERRQIPNKPSEWCFCIQDNGIGMKSEHFERIFKIFQRLHSRQEYPGTGIGLAMCQKIVERHGGGIWVESEPGKGARFYFTIPVKNK